MMDSQVQVWFSGPSQLTHVRKQSVACRINKLVLVNLEFGGSIGLDIIIKENMEYKQT